jgi:AI-2 transport protein TqsA
VFWIIVMIINLNIAEISLKWPDYKIKFEWWIQIVSDRLSFYGHTYFGIKDDISIKQKLISYINVPDVIGNVVTGITFAGSIVKNILIVLIYTGFLLFEAKFFGQKMHFILGNDAQEKKILWILAEVKWDLKLYFLIRTILSALTGVATYLVLKFFDLDFALFWGFIACVFNFIPAVGSFIAVAFPVLFSLVQFDSLYVSIAMLASLMVAQFVFWNLLEPKLLWNKLNLSPIFILLSLAFWAILWGFTGMLLCVPIMVIMNAVLSEFESTKPVAILFSERWLIRSDVITLHEHKQKMIEKIKEKFKKKKK